MFKALYSNFLDFLYPKSDEVYELEGLNTFELVSKLPQAEDLGEDVLAVFAYHDKRVRELVWELKYRANPIVVESLAIILFDVLKTELAERALTKNFINPLLIPVPMSEKRKLERGFNQTEVLCEKLCELDTEKLLTYSPNILKKVKHTESQTLIKNKKERKQNLEGSMLAGDVRGRNVVLVDDVTTTGATFGDARRALHESGARKILCLALAH